VGRVSLVIAGGVVVLPVDDDTLEEVDEFEEIDGLESGVSAITPIAPIRRSMAATTAMIGVPIPLLEVLSGCIRSIRLCGTDTPFLMTPLSMDYSKRSRAYSTTD
jgi:hypothetical protein